MDVTILIIAFVGVNYFSQFNKEIFYESHAQGLDYTSGNVEYSLDRIVSLSQDEESYRQDRDAMMSTLDKWAKKELRANLQ